MNPGRFLTVAMIVFALVVVPMAAYVGGYYGLPVNIYTDTINGRPLVVRWYAQHWQASLYRPAGRAEAWLTGGDVRIVAVR
jgi:hypothetical protein